MNKNFQRKDTYSVRINNEIPYKEARVIYKENNNESSPNDFNKVMNVREAQKFAFDKGLDLIEINGKVNPPILKIYEYSKYLWELKQAEKKKKKNNVDVKEIQLSVNISMHDMETKAKKAIEFLTKGHKVKVVLMMRGRELTRRDESSKSFYEFLNLLVDYAAFDCAPKNEGNKIITILKKKK